MILPNNGRNGFLIGYLLPSDASITKNRLHLIELMAKGVPWKYKTTQDIDKAIDSFPQSEGKVLLLKTAPVQLIEHKTSNFPYLKPSSLCANIFGTGRFSTHDQRRNVNISQPQALDLQQCPNCKICQGNEGTSL